jgi:xylulokinase
VLLLGIDIGTTRTKAVLLDGDGRETGGATIRTPFVHHDRRVEMDVDALRYCLEALLTDLGDARRDVAAVGLAGMAESGAPLDGARRPLAPVIAWHDGRGEEAVLRLKSLFDRDLALRIGQPVRTVLTAAKLGWLVEHGVEGVDRWLGVPELALQALTEVEATEYSLAARTGCYDVADRTWIPEVADVLGFPIEVFPPVLAAGAAMGIVSPPGAAWSGLPVGIPVTVAGHDHLAGMAGAGLRPGSMANSVGTAEIVVGRSATVPDVAAALDLGAAVTVYPGGGEWAGLVSVVRSGLVLEAAANALGRSPGELDDLADQVTEVEVDLTDAVDGLARGDSSGLPEAPAGEVWAGLLAALAGRTVDAYGRLATLVGPAERVVAFGGGSVSRPWLRAKAAGLPAPLWRSAVASAVARGAAVHAGVAAGRWPSADDAPPPEGTLSVGSL